MRKIELLAPAGSMDALYAAVQCGADAVYLGGQMFGARAFAHNFDINQLQEAVSYAHLYGVLVYVTINTLIYGDEIQTCLSYMKQLQDAQVDAFIIQDLGVLKLAHEHFPDMELHASTQMHIHHEAGIKFLKEYGVKRIVVARETTLEQLKQFTKLGVDIEAFVHGAICVSYSGQCLLSSDILDRSGNRGMCAQPCRMRYSLLEDNQVVSNAGSYLLSPKDLFNLDHMGDLIDAGVTSFKIEGRMKKSEYVAQVVSSYRKAIDAHLKHQHYDVKEDTQRLQKLFHRGFTSGHLYEQRGLNLMNWYRPNHMGIVLGEVVQVRKDKIRIALAQDLSQLDGIRIIGKKEDDGFIVNRLYDLKGNLISHAKANQMVELDKRRYVEKGAKVIKSSDHHLEEELHTIVKNNPRKVGITMEAYLKLNEPVVLHVSDGCHDVVVTSTMCCEQAQKQGMDQASIQKQLMKCGDTPYEIKNIQIILEPSLFITIKALNELRRKALQELNQKRIQKKERRIIHHPNAYLPVSSSNGVRIYYHVSNLKQAEALKNTSGIIVCEGPLVKQLQAHQIPHIEMAPRVMIRPYQNQSFIQEVGGLKQANILASAPSLNVVNPWSLRFLKEHGVRDVFLSEEYGVHQIIELMRQYEATFQELPSAGVKIYGRSEDMISKHCVMSTCLKKGQKYCGICREHEYALLDEKGRKFPLYGDEDCFMHVLSTHTRNWIEEMNFLHQNHINSYYVRFYEEDVEVVTTIRKQIEKEVERFG